MAERSCRWTVGLLRGWKGSRQIPHSSLQKMNSLGCECYRQEFSRDGQSLKNLKQSLMRERDRHWERMRLRKRLRERERKGVLGIYQVQRTQSQFIIGPLRWECCWSPYCSSFWPPFCTPKRSLTTASKFLRRCPRKWKETGHDHTFLHTCSSPSWGWGKSFLWMKTKVQIILVL